MSFIKKLSSLLLLSQLIMIVVTVGSEGIPIIEAFIYRF